MKNNLHKNTKNELIDEILKLRESELKLREEIEDLKWENQDLKWKLNINSSNSSKSSSTEILKKKTQICNSRIKWQNPRWWVKWHIWNTLKQFEKPDFVEKLEVFHCEKCNFDLEKVQSFKETKRQVIDISKPVFTVTEYQSQEKVCPCCNHINKAKFPEWVEQSIQFWQNIQASSVYMYNYQMTSFKRQQEYFKEIYSLDISQTTFMSFNEKRFWNLESFEEQLKSALIQSPIIHSDETWVRINWKTNRIHTVWTKKMSYYSAQEKRWKQAMDEMKILEFFTWILVSDHWSSYKIFTNFLLHCFCNAHHLRELKWVLENEGKMWSEEMIKLLLEAKKLKEEAQKRWETFLCKSLLDELHNEFRTILRNWKFEYEWIKRIIWKRWKHKKSKWLNLLLRLEQSEAGSLWFIDNFEIPFDNNLAERDLRMIKTRTKISGCFRSFDGAKYFCRIRSYISTMKKQNLDIYNSLSSIFSWNLLLPKF